jgi:tripartite-type tricarboxylate transporter receptor subunit TctC
MASLSTSLALRLSSLALAAFAFAATLPAPASAQWKPTQPIRVIIPYAAGGTSDIIARSMSDEVSKRLGQPFTIENRGGGATQIGTSAVAKAEPDGHTILMTLSSLAVLPESERLFGRQPAYEVNQLVPVARVLADPTLLAVPASAPWKTLQEFVDDAKKRPGTIPYGSSGAYGTLHVAMEMFATEAGIKLLHVPYRGAGPAVTGLLSGQIQALASAPGVLKEHVDAGTMRVLANWGAQRIPSFPDLPTFKELGYTNVEFYIWAGLFVPRGVPDAIVTRLRDAMRQAMNDPEVTKIFTNAGSPPAYQDAPDFAKFVEADSARLITAVQKIGKVE